MRSFVCLLLGAIFLAGCESDKGQGKTDQKGIPGEPSQNKVHEKIIVTPESSLVGKIVRINKSPRFAVLNFPVGKLPAIGASMSIFRQGSKIGAVRISGPQLDDNIIADVTDGSVQVGDEVRGD
jgi:hypothetical protein